MKRRVARPELHCLPEALDRVIDIQLHPQNSTAAYERPSKIRLERERAIDRRKRFVRTSQAPQHHRTVIESIDVVWPDRQRRATAIGAGNHVHPWTCRFAFEAGQSRADAAHHSLSFPTHCRPVVSSWRLGPSAFVFDHLPSCAANKLLSRRSGRTSRTGSFSR